MIRDVHPGSGSRFSPFPNPDFLPIPDPGVKKAPDPGSASLLMIVKAILSMRAFVGTCTYNNV
jgi:hypothetical protein